MLEAVTLWVETNARLLGGLAALVVISTFVWKLVGPRLVEQVNWWRFVMGYAFMQPRSQKIMRAWHEQLALLPFDQQGRAAKLMGQYYQTPKEDRKALLANLREDDRGIVQKFVDKADVLIFAEAMNELFDEDGNIKEEYQKGRKRG